MESINNIHKKDDNYSMGLQNFSPCIKNKKWSISKLFFKKKEINSESSSQEDEAGFKSIQKSNRTRSNKQKVNIKKIYDSSKRNGAELYHNIDVSMMCLEPKQRHINEPEFELFLPFETSPINVNAAHQHKLPKHNTMRHSTSSLTPLYEKPLTVNHSSNTSLSHRIHENIDNSGLLVNANNRRTRSARNERYYKRLSRDFENSTKKESKPIKSKDFFNNSNSCHNNRKSQLSGDSDSNFRNTCSLQHISPYVSWSKHSQVSNKLLNSIETKRSISYDSQIYSNITNKCLPPTPPPRGTSRNIHVNTSIQNINKPSSRPQSYAFDENSRLFSSEIKHYDNILIKSGQRYQSRSAHVLHSTPITSVTKNSKTEEPISKSRRFITRGNRSPLIQKSSPTGNLTTHNSYGTLSSIDGTAPLSKKTVPSTIQYIADALPGSRKPIYINNMANNDIANQQYGESFEVLNKLNISDEMMHPHIDWTENANINLVGRTENVTHIKQNKHRKLFKNHKNVVSSMPANFSNSKDVCNVNLYDRYVAERREKHKNPIYETYKGEHNYVKVNDTLHKSQIESSSNLEDAINELETVYKTFDFREKTDNNASCFELKKNNYYPYDYYDDESPSGEPDPVLDDIAYRNMKFVNNKRVEVLPFGIPIRPIFQTPKTDYLNIHSISNNEKFEITNLPDIVKDDLAVRTLRKDKRLSNQVCTSPKYGQKENRAVRTQSANIFSLIKRDAAKPSGGDFKCYTELRPNIKRSGSAEYMPTLNIKKDDCDVLKRLHNKKHEDYLVTSKHVQIPFQHPSQKGAISELPNKLFTTSDILKKRVIAKHKSLSPQFVTTNNEVENVFSEIVDSVDSKENSITLSKKLKAQCKDTCSYNALENNLINSTEEMENVSNKAKCVDFFSNTMTNNLTSIPGEIVSINNISLSKIDKEFRDGNFGFNNILAGTSSLEICNPKKKCDLVVPNLLKNLDPIKSEKVEEISKRCMLELSKLGNDIELVDKNKVIIEPEIVHINSIFEKCQQNISPKNRIIDRDLQQKWLSSINEKAHNSSVGASSFSSSSDCLVKSSSLSVNLHQSSSLTSFNPYSSSDYIKSSSSENPTLSTDAIKTFSTTSYDAKSSSTTPNITTNSNISHSLSPPLHLPEGKDLIFLPAASNGCLLLQPEYNSTEELTTIFGIGQYLLSDDNCKNTKTNENNSGHADHVISGNKNCDNIRQQLQDSTTYKEHHPHFYNHTSANYSTNERLQPKNLENIYDTLNENYKSVYKSPTILTETQQFPNVIKTNIYKQRAVPNELPLPNGNKTILDKVVNANPNWLCEEAKGDLFNVTNNLTKHRNNSLPKESKFEKCIHQNESVDYTNNTSSYLNTNTSNVLSSSARSRYLYRFANRKRIVRVRSESRPINFLYDIMYKENCLNHTSDEDSEIAKKSNKEDQINIKNIEKSNNLENLKTQSKSICDKNKIPLLNSLNTDNHNKNSKLLFNSRTEINKTDKDFCLKSSSLPPYLISSECNNNTQIQGEIKQFQNNYCDKFKVENDCSDECNLKNFNTVNDEIIFIKTGEDAILNSSEVFNNHLTQATTKENQISTNKEKLVDESPTKLNESVTTSSRVTSDSDESFVSVDIYTEQNDHLNNKMHNHSQLIDSNGPEQVAVIIKRKNQQEDIHSYSHENFLRSRTSPQNIKDIEPNIHVTDTCNNAKVLDVNAAPYVNLTKISGIKNKSIVEDSFLSQQKLPSNNKDPYYKQKCSMYCNDSSNKQNQNLRDIDTTVGMNINSNFQPIKNKKTVTNNMNKKEYSEVKKEQNQKENSDDFFRDKSAKRKSNLNRSQNEEIILNSSKEVSSASLQGMASQLKLTGYLKPNIKRIERRSETLPLNDELCKQLLINRNQKLNERKFSDPAIITQNGKPITLDSGNNISDEKCLLFPPFKSSEKSHTLNQKIDDILIPTSADPNQVVSILKRKDCCFANERSLNISNTNPITMSTNIFKISAKIKRLGILKKRTSLDDSGNLTHSHSSDRRNMLSELMRRNSLEESTLQEMKENHTHGILKQSCCDGSKSDSSVLTIEMHPHSILKKKDISSTISVSQPILFRPNEIACEKSATENLLLLEDNYTFMNDEHEIRPILKQESINSDEAVRTPKPILKKKISGDSEEQEIRPILKSSRKSSREEFDECLFVNSETQLSRESTVRPILKTTSLLKRRSLSSFESCSNASKPIPFLLNRRTRSLERHVIPFVDLGAALNAIATSTLEVDKDELCANTHNSVSERVKYMESILNKNNNSSFMLPTKVKNSFDMSRNHNTDVNINIQRRCNPRDRYKTQPVTLNEKLIFQETSSALKSIEKGYLSNVAFISKMSQTNKDLSQPTIEKMVSKNDLEIDKQQKLIENNAIEEGGITRSNSVRDRANMFQKLQEEIILPKKTASQFSPSKLHKPARVDSFEPGTELLNKSNVDEETDAL